MRQIVVKRYARKARRWSFKCRRTIRSTRNRSTQQPKRVSSHCGWWRRRRSASVTRDLRCGAIRPRTRICCSSSRRRPRKSSAATLFSASKPLQKSERGKRVFKRKRKRDVSVSLTRNGANSRFRLSPEEAGIGMSKFSLRDTIISDSCPAHPTCDRETAESPFRTIDGSCNNLERTAWGKSKTQFQRALLPHYADGKLVFMVFSWALTSTPKR